MTDEQQNEDGTAEAIEDLEAPAAAQHDVAGGKVICATPTCGDTEVWGYCHLPTCGQTKSGCGNNSQVVIVYEA